jgi:SAM-dependent methyltransferase
MSQICYLCRQQMEFFLRKDGYDIWRCPVCNLAKTNLGKPYDKFIKEFYGKGYFTGDVAYSAYSGYLQDKQYICRNLEKQLKRSSRFKSNGKLLDVGCAMGYLVEIAAKAGYDAYGFDPSEYAISKADKLIVKRVKVSDIDNVSYPKSTFDIVTMLDVLEHLNDPILSLQKISGFLKKDGILVIATGDTDCLTAKLMGRLWTFYNPPQHLFFFTRANLMTLLDRIGFEAINWQRIDKWLSLQYVLHLADSDSHIPFTGTIGKLVNRFGLGSLPVFLPIRDNITVVARRKRG